MPSKRGAVEEAFRLKSLERSRRARPAVVTVTPKVIADYRDERRTPKNYRREAAQHP